jgi:hypothetical protein
MGCFTPDISIPAAPSVPEPTQQEKDYQAIETQLAQQNLDINKQSATDQAAERAKFEEAVGMPYADYMAKIAKSTQDLNTAYLDRYQKAMKGELPVDPTLERALTENKATLQESMLKKLGPGWETSTSGIQALAEYDKRAEELRSAAQQGTIMAGEQQGYATNPMAWVPGLAQPSTVSTPTQITDLLKQWQNERLAQYGGAMNAYTGNLNAAQLSAQNSSNPLGSILGMFGGGMMGGIGSKVGTALALKI